MQKDCRNNPCPAVEGGEASLRSRVCCTPRARRGVANCAQTLYGIDFIGARGPDRSYRSGCGGQRCAPRHVEQHCATAFGLVLPVHREPVHRFSRSTRPLKPDAQLRKPALECLYPYPDGFNDIPDNCPANPNADQTDKDSDGMGDLCDDFPTNPMESIDTDGDGMGDNFEMQFGLNAEDPSDANLDSDSDGLTNLEEFQQGRIPTVNEGALIPIIILPLD